MAANTPGPSLNIYEVCCVLCAAKLEESGRSEYTIEEELNKLSIAVLIDDKSRICKLCFKRLRKRKSFREGWQGSTEKIVHTFSRALSQARESASLPSSFVPLYTYTTIKSSRPNNSSMTVNVPLTVRSLALQAHVWKIQQTEPKESESSRQGMTFLLHSKEHADRSGT